MRPLIASLVFQAQAGQPSHVVSDSGCVRFPGDYLLMENMNVVKLLEAAGGLVEAAYNLEGEISRSSIDESQFRKSNNIQEGYSDNPESGSISHRALLQARDQLYIKSIPGWNEKEFADVQGQDNFPEKHPMFPGDAIKTLKEHAGGLTGFADPRRSIFLRQSFLQWEQEQMQSYSFSSDIAMAKASGHLVIDKPAILHGEDNKDVHLLDGDRLILLCKSKEISVVGEVQLPSSYLYRDDFDAFKSISVSGGCSPKANRGNVYVIGANIEVRPVKKKLFISRNAKVSSGDTVVVPCGVYSVSPLTSWTSASQFLLNLSATAAASKAVGAL